MWVLDETSSYEIDILSYVNGRNKTGSKKLYKENKM